MPRLTASAALVAAFCASAFVTARADPPEAPKAKVTVLFSFLQSPSSGLAVGPDDALYGAYGLQVYRLFQDDDKNWLVRTVFTFPTNVQIPQLKWRQGVLYGVSTFGGDDCHSFPSPGCGFVFALTPPKKPEDPWTQKTLYRFPAGRRDPELRGDQ